MSEIFNNLSRQGARGIKHVACKPRHLLSKLFQPVQDVPFDTEVKPKKFEDTTFSKSHRMLVDFGLIRSCHHGSYAYLPLALRSIDKLSHLIDQHMEGINAHKILLPTMTDGSLWKKSGRWHVIQDELFRLKNRHEHDLILGPTYEEAITNLVANDGVIPLKSLPIRLYQISTKFRDEMRTKSGLIRSKEFIMKDLYTFDVDIEHAEKTYESVREAYKRIFDTLQVPYVSVLGDTGSIGGSLSHEYHFLSDIGQDDLLICHNCEHGFNEEMQTSSEDYKCSKCDGQYLEKKKGVEVGHTFLLGDKYSKIFKAKYMPKKGKPQILQMGCFGLGVSRILASSLEILSTEENRLRWPMEIAPFKVMIIAPKDGSKEFVVMDQVFRLYDQLNNSNMFFNDVIIDDRSGVTVGKKLRDAKKTGYPWVILFGRDCIHPTNPVVELHDYEDTISVPVNQILFHFESINNHK